MDLTKKLQAEQDVGDFDATSLQWYLLNDGFCVLRAHTCAEKDAVGAFFFDLFPAKRAVLEEVSAYVRSYPSQMLLTLCGSAPVLFVGAPVMHAGLVLAVLPQGEIKRTLTALAPFHGVPACVCVSRSAQMRYKAHAERPFAAACRWLLYIGAAFAYPTQTAPELAATLSRCVTRLGKLLEVPVDYDFSGLPLLACDASTVDFAIGVVLATLVAAKGTGDGSGVRLYAAMEGAPTLHMEYACNDPSDTVPELQAVLACAAVRGAVLDVVCPVEDPHRVQVRAALGAVELSAQSVRERHRFLEGKSPLGTLPQCRAIPVAFPRLSLN